MIALIVALSYHLSNVHLRYTTYKIKCMQFKPTITYFLFYRIVMVSWSSTPTGTVTLLMVKVYLLG